MLHETLPRTLLSCHSATDNLLLHNGIESNTFKQFVGGNHHIRDGSLRGQGMVGAGDWQC